MDFAPIAWDGFLVNCVQFAAFSILLYEYGTSWADEVECIWRHVKIPSAVIFLLLRYTALFGFGVLCYTSIVPPPYESCAHWITFREMLFSGLLCLVFLLAAMRTYALWGQSRVVLTIFIVAEIFVVAMNVWAFIDSDPRQHFVSPFFGCHQVDGQALSTNLAVPYITVFVLDSLVIILMISRVVILAPPIAMASPFKSTTRGLPLISMVLRDGILYFITIAAVTLANLLVIFLGDPALKVLMTSLSTSLSVVMIQKMTLNLYKSAEATGEGTTAPTQTKGMDGPMLTTIVIPESDSYYDGTGSEFQYEEYMKELER